ncbi:hypothetical protein [Salinicola halophilus]|uniref:hypothetical protein n=1 Tax=Salinicola halophilus TaxID=184065 RepID=UPI0013A663C9|nr:hypothetical protein [Salinicola halophilus]
MQKYILYANYLGKHAEVEIKEEEYHSAKKGMSFFKHSLRAETNFDITFKMFMEAEREILNIASKNSFYHIITPEKFYEYRVLMNARINALLLSARFYLDKIESQVEKTLGKDSKSELKSFISEQYDNCKYYRLMFKLRNYVAHGEQPVHRIILPSGWDQNREHMECRCEIYAEKEALLENNQFTEKFLESHNDKIDLMLASKKFIKSLFLILERYRKMRASKQSDYNNCITRLIDDYRVHEPKIGRQTPLTLRKINSEGVETEKLLIHSNQIDICRMLEEQNRFLNAIDSKHVSSKVYSTP